ncbi:MAG: hypothetical protein GOV00_00105 [Candidatus Altiarchaeota archaeon]|nr:hypothetical protein [Candidatus Altiarchaeota archaeon]
MDSRLRLALVLSLFFILVPVQATTMEWWNSSWSYRYCISINSSSYSRTDWPIEIDLNFTNLMGGGATFNKNTTRVIEQDTTSGAIIGEKYYQFDEASIYEPTTNALGTLIFHMNGTQAYENQSFCIYYDTNETSHAAPTYDTDFNYTLNGEILNVNVSVEPEANTGVRFWLDSQRGELTSGFYRVQDFNDNDFWSLPADDERPLIYSQYTNTSSNFSFEAEPFQVIHEGPLRFVFEHTANETYWNQTGNNTEGRMTFRYTFYWLNQWVKVEQIFNNTAAYAINRSSTPAGAMRFESFRAGFDFVVQGNNSDPSSWQWAAADFANYHVGIINKEESVSNFSAQDRNVSSGYIGIELDQVTIASGANISEEAVIHFNSPQYIKGSPSSNQIRDLSRRFTFSPIIGVHSYERWKVEINASTDYLHYNRNETALIYLNLTYDSGNLTKSVNATLFYSSGNETFPLYDDGSHGDGSAGDLVYTTTYNVTNTSDVGVWNVSITAYGISDNVLNQSNTSFTVHNKFSSQLFIENPYGYASRRVNATLVLQNYRNDTTIFGANVNCSWNGQSGATIVDEGNGNYTLNFTSPDSYGIYTLNCTSSKDNNWGMGLNTFTVIELNTTFSVAISEVPPGATWDNITQAENQTIIVLANVTNLGNGTADNANFTFYLPGGWASNSTFVTLGFVDLLESKLLYFEVTAPNATVPGDYPFNGTVFWTDPDLNVSNQSGFVNLTVDQNPAMNVSETNISTVATPGQWSFIQNITVNSIGNFELVNVTFSVVGLQNMTFNFTPWNISQLNASLNQTVEIWVFVPSNHSRGTFYGTLFVNESTGLSDSVALELQLLETEMNLEVEPLFIQADNTGWFEFTNFTFQVNTSNTGSSTGIAVNISIEGPPTWITNYTNNVANCGDMLPGENCSKPFEIAIKQAPPTIYNLIVNVSWYNPGIGVKYNATQLQINVTTNPEVNVTPLNISGIGNQGQSTNFTGIQVTGLGNVDVINAAFTVVGFDGNFSFSFDPLLSTIPVGMNTTVWVNVTISSGKDPGNYSGTFYLNSSNAPNITRPINVEVPISRSWYLSPNNCLAAMTQDEGEICNITIINTGNVQFDINITENYKNHTYVNQTLFTLPKEGASQANFRWNFTGIQRDFYNISYLFNLTTGTGSPDWAFFNITLLPSEPPIIILNQSSNITMQDDGLVIIYANITDMSMQGLASVRLRVSKPGGLIVTHDMAYVTNFNNSWLYYDTFPGGWGSLNVTGSYTFTVLVTDALAISGQNSTSVYVYPKLNASVRTGFGLYFAGESSSIYLTTGDTTTVKLPSNISFTIYDPDGNMRMNFTGQTGVNGTYEPIPSFLFPSDAPLGDYRFELYAEHYDSISGQLVNDSHIYLLPVVERYEGDFTTSVAWYPNSVMDFYLMLHTQREIEAPDSMEITVYDPAQNVFLTATSGFDTVTSTNQTLMYLYDYAMPINTSAGYYLADMSVWKGGRLFKFIDSFRVSQGGPYDVVIESILAEAPQGGQVDFTLLLQNMGDVSQDVFVDFWITDSNGNVYENISSQPIYVEGGNERSVDRSMNIYSNQPLGIYTLNVRMRYSPLQPVLETSRTFQVVEPEEETPPLIPPILEPVDAAVIEVTVNNLFPDELFMSKGAVAYLTVELENTGTVDLSDLTVFFEGVPTSWFEVIRSIPYLAPRSKGYVVIRFTVPSDAEARTYVMKMRVIATEVEIEEHYKLTVFKTNIAALQARIDNLNNRISQLEERAGELAASGADVSRVLALLRKSRDMISAAEIYLSEDKTVDAINTISEIENTLEEVEYRLSIASPVIFRPQIPSISLELILAILATIVIIIVLVLLARRMSLEFSSQRKRAIRKVSKIMGEKREVAPTSDLVELLRKQYEEGLVSRETFDELKGFLK